jgi:hypothetical protein
VGEPLRENAGWAVQVGMVVRKPVKNMCYVTPPLFFSPPQVLALEDDRRQEHGPTAETWRSLVHAQSEALFLSDPTLAVE